MAINVSKEDSYNRGMELFAEDKLDEAAAAYMRALEEDPNYADALHALAMTYSHQEKIDEAIEVGKRLVDAAPDDGGRLLRIILRRHVDVMPPFQAVHRDGTLVIAGTERNSVKKKGKEKGSDLHVLVP